MFVPSGIRSKHLIPTQQQFLYFFLNLVSLDFVIVVEWNFLVCHSKIHSCISFRGGWLTGLCASCVLLFVPAWTGMILKGFCAWVGLLWCGNVCWNVQDSVCVCGWLGNIDIPWGNSFQYGAWIVFFLNKINDLLHVAYVCFRQWKICSSPRKCMKVVLVWLMSNLDEKVLESIVCSDTWSFLSGGTGETAAASKPHPGGLWQCKDRQEWQLLKICKND